MRAGRLRSMLIPLLQKLAMACSGQAAEQTLPDGEGCASVTLPFENLEEAGNRLLGLGRAVEVLEPGRLRLSIVDSATRILSLDQRKQ
jgi:predicted DNA-binding transcriptional regulator YafY